MSAARHPNEADGTAGDASAGREVPVGLRNRALLPTPLPSFRGQPPFGT